MTYNKKNLYIVISRYQWLNDNDNDSHLY